jgi:molybdopterin-containing oxidoreductase family iron-sulfur binding subunit
MNPTGKQYWRSLDENSPQLRQWLDREFPEAASTLDSTSRRTLLKLMAASFGLAGLTACSRPEEKLMPLSKGVEGYVPGNPLYYSTVFSLGGSAAGMVVEVHDGRPTKIEGNPAHPFSRGAASAFQQASILGLYDPDRSRAGDWDACLAAARPRLAGRVRFLSQTVNSPSLEAVRAHALAQLPDARWVEYEPLNQDNAAAGAELAFGQPLAPLYAFDRADVIVSLDSDFLALDAPAVTWLRDFSRRRRVASERDTMNRLYVVESQFSVTGGMADHRRRMRTSEVPGFAIALARELGLLPGGASNDKFVAAVARDLNRSHGRALVVAGPRQPAEVHALAHWINHALSGPVTYVRSGYRPQAAALRQLASEMSAGAVDALFILGGNPVYDAPADFEFAHAMKKVPFSVHLGVEPNETAALATWRLGEAHYLESWSDARALDGAVSIQQPLIRPLFGGRTAAELVAALAGYKDRRAYDIVRNYWLAQFHETVWRQALSDGVLPPQQSLAVEPKLDAGRIAAEAAKPAAALPGIELTFYPSATVWDGRFANNGWLQEAPDPVTKLTWDNVALMSPATARELGVASEDLVAIQSQGREITAPVWVQPGHADRAISIALGYGRTRCGRVGQGVGVDAYPLRASAGFHFTSVTVRKTGRQHRLAATQQHHGMEGRPLVQEADLAAYRKDPAFVEKKKPELFSIFGQHSYDQGYQWGMAIDLNACVGCNACILACQAENNIPIVGKDQVARGREMHWIRMDRYYAGSEDNPESVTQPVACQQCEQAPCENVCPVAATTHSPEGLNDMVYNRCVGTRYCANNCPYKVRRFNFLEWHKDEPEVRKMAYNPDVTVRMRGVMEKCTYCVQRIQEKKIQAKTEGRRALRDGEVVTACQQTCPAEAIVFGNINDPASRVSQLKHQNRDYALLAELNTKPRTSYLAKLRNPNPELA